MLFWKSGFKTISLGYAHTCNYGSVLHWFNRTGILIRTGFLVLDSLILALKRYHGEYPLGRSCPA